MSIIKGSDLLQKFVKSKSNNSIKINSKKPADMFGYLAYPYQYKDILFRDKVNFIIGSDRKLLNLMMTKIEADQMVYRKIIHISPQDYVEESFQLLLANLTGQIYRDIKNPNNKKIPYLGTYLENKIDENIKYLNFNNDLSFFEELLFEYKNLKQSTQKDIVIIFNGVDRCFPKDQRVQYMNVLFKKIQESELLGNSTLIFSGSVDSFKEGPDANYLTIKNKQNEVEWIGKEFKVKGKIISEQYLVSEEMMSSLPTKHSEVISKKQKNIQSDVENGSGLPLFGTWKELLKNIVPNHIDDLIAFYLSFYSKEIKMAIIYHFAKKNSIHFEVIPSRYLEEMFVLGDILYKFNENSESIVKANQIVDDLKLSGYTDIPKDKEGLLKILNSMAK